MDFLISYKRRPVVIVMSDDDNDDEAIPGCDLCGKKAKRRSLMMEYHNGGMGSFDNDSEGDLIRCACLKKVKPELYTIRYSGRQMLATRDYNERCWKEDEKGKVLKEPTQTVGKRTSHSDNKNEGERLNATAEQKTKDTRTTKRQKK